MNKFATIEPAYRFRLVTFYTVRFEEEDESLFLQFINKHAGDEFAEQMAIFRFWFRKLGNEIGAQEEYFRHEGFRGGDAKALPPPSKYRPPSQYIGVDSDLRLYCMRVNRGAVILFSGARKTADSAQECDNVRPHFLLANKLTKAIDQAIREGDIEIDPETDHLLFDDELTLEITL